MQVKRNAVTYTFFFWRCMSELKNTMRELKCQIALISLEEESFSINQGMLFLHWLGEGKEKKYIFEFMLTVKKNRMDICGPLNGLGYFTNISFDSTPFLPSFCLFCPRLYFTDNYPSKKVIKWQVLLQIQKDILGKDTSMLQWQFLKCHHSTPVMSISCWHEFGWSGQLHGNSACAMLQGFRLFPLLEPTIWIIGLLSNCHFRGRDRKMA